MNFKDRKNEIANAYDRIYATHGLRSSTKYYKWIASLLKPRKGKFLDCACGEGILLSEIEKKNTAVETFGFDISQEACKIASKNSPNSAIFVCDGHNIPYEQNYFDYVTCLGSIEHFVDPAAGIKEISRVLKNDGLSCIVLPNSFSIEIILEIMFKGDDTSMFQIIERRETKNAWIKLIEDNGLYVIKTYASNLLPEFFNEGTFKLKSIKKFVKTSLIKLCCPLNLAREFAFICSKKHA